MSKWSDSLSRNDKEEMIADLCDAYKYDYISEKELRRGLANLGLNAIEIEEKVNGNLPDI